MYQFAREFPVKVTRPVFLYQSKLEFFGCNSQYHLI